METDDPRETKVALDPKAEYRAEGKPGTRETVLAAGVVARVAPARPAIVLVFTEKALAAKSP